MVGFEWEPERSPDGPVSLLLSTEDAKLYVYRNGVEIGFAEVHFLGSENTLPGGIHAVLDGYSDEESPLVPGRKMHRWMHVSNESTESSLSEDSSFSPTRCICLPCLSRRSTTCWSPARPW